MRITGGHAKGIPLQTITHATLRPATDAMREAVFSSLSYLTQESCILDIFAGTGAYGLEALSRGAKEAIFIEQNKHTQIILKKNIQAVCKSLNINTAICSVGHNAFTWSSDKQFDLIFIDPPYLFFKTAVLSELFLKISNWMIPSTESRCMLELPGEIENPAIPGLECIKRLGKKGKNQPSICIYRLIPVTLP